MRNTGRSILRPERAVCLLRLDCHRLLSGVYGCRLSLKSDIYEDVVYVKYESNSETFMCQMLAEFVCKKGTRMNESDLKDYKNS